MLDSLRKRWIRLNVTIFKSKKRLILSFWWEYTWEGGEVVFKKCLYIRSQLYFINQWTHFDQIKKNIWSYIWGRFIKKVVRNQALFESKTLKNIIFSLFLKKNLFSYYWHWFFQLLRTLYTVSNEENVRSGKIMCFLTVLFRCS